MSIRILCPEGHPIVVAASIRARGVIQPILVRRVKEGGYRIVAGERRWRAAQVAGLAEIPIIVKDVSESAVDQEELLYNASVLAQRPANRFA